MSQILVSLGEGATYEIFHELFNLIACQLPWQANAPGGGWNISLNGTDVHVLEVNDEGIKSEAAVDEDFEQFEEPTFMKWEDVESIVIF
jgi:hypothetical protein